MNYKRPVYRTCLISKEKLLKSELIRLTRINNEVSLDLNQSLGGRGVYIKKDNKVIELAIRKDALSKALKAKVKEEIYQELIRLVK